MQSRKTLLAVILLLFAALPPTYSQEAVDELVLTPHFTMTLNNGVFDVAWSSDGKYLALADTREQISVWESGNWSLITTFNCDDYYFSQLFSWHPSQPVLAVSCSDSDEPIKTTTISDSLTIIKFNTIHQAVAWSPDGNFIAVTQADSTIGILNSAFELLFTIGEPYFPPEPSSELPTMDGSGGQYIDFTWSPAGNYLVSTSIGQTTYIAIWDLATQAVVQDFSHAIDFMWSSDENNFSVTLVGERGDTTIQIWSIAPFQILSSAPTPYNHDAIPLAGMPSGRYIVNCAYPENQLDFYDTLTLQKIAVIAAPSGEPIPCPINDLAWSSENSLAIAEDDGQVSIWEIGSILPDSP